MSRIGYFTAALVLGGLALGGCKGPNSVEGDINGEAFGTAPEAIFVGDIDGDGANLKLMIANFENACQNYTFYAENQQYDAENAFAEDGEAAPRYLLWTVFLQEDILGTRDVLPQGQFYEGSMGFISGRYSEGDGAGNFDPTLMSGGSITFEEVEAGVSLVGSFDVDFSTGDAASGNFEATYCDP